MTDSKQMLNALRYLDNQVNGLYRLVEHHINVSDDLTQQDIDAVIRSVKTLFNNYEYLISDRYIADTERRNKQ